MCQCNLKVIATLHKEATPGEVLIAELMDFCDKKMKREGNISLARVISRAVQHKTSRSRFNFGCWIYTWLMTLWFLNMHVLCGKEESLSCPILSLSQRSDSNSVPLAIFNRVITSFECTSFQIEICCNLRRVWARSTLHRSHVQDYTPSSNCASLSFIFPVRSPWIPILMRGDAGGEHAGTRIVSELESKCWASFLNGSVLVIKIFMFYVVFSTNHGT